MTQRYWTKDPDELLDYEFDFAAKTNGVPDAMSDYLESNETIQTYTLSAPAGITLEADALIKNDTCVRFWARGGEAEKNYRVTIEVITTNSRVVQRSQTLRVRSR